MPTEITEMCYKFYQNTVSLEQSTIFIQELKNSLIDYKTFVESLIENTISNVQLCFGMKNNSLSNTKHTVISQMLNEYTIKDIENLLIYIEEASIKIIQANDKKPIQELILLNLSTQIRNIKEIATNTFAFESENEIIKQASVENEIGSNLAIEKLNQKNGPAIETVDVNDDMLADIFGTTMQSIPNATNVDTTVNIIAPENNDVTTKNTDIAQEQPTTPTTMNIDIANIPLEPDYEEELINIIPVQQVENMSANPVFCTEEELLNLL